MTHVSGRWRAAVLSALGALALSGSPAGAEVRFGPGVRIGGHDFSDRRADSIHIERVKRLRGPPGCRRGRQAWTGAATAPWCAARWRKAI
jgi:hypothetical protein